MIKFADILLMYKGFHGLPSPLLNEFTKQNQNSSTRVTTRGDCETQYR